MIVNYTYPKCVLCLKVINKNCKNKEHIIPKLIGGKLQAYILCRDCNSRLGHNLVHKLNKSSEIRLAATGMRDQIPDIFTDIENYQSYDTPAPSGDVIKAKMLKGALTIVPGGYSGSMVLPTANAAEHIKSLLRAKGSDEATIKSTVQQFSETPNGVLVKVDQELSFIRWNLTKAKQNYQGNQLLDNKLIILMAYEYLALVIGKKIYLPALDYIRNHLTNGTIDDHIFIEELSTQKYRPIHRIYPEYKHSQVIITIELFGYLVYRVHFAGLHVSPTTPDTVYLEDLKERQSLIAETVAKAKQGYYKSI